MTYPCLTHVHHVIPTSKSATPRLLGAFAVAELYRIAGQSNGNGKSWQWQEFVEISNNSTASPENVRATLQGCQIILMSISATMNLNALVVIILQAHHASRLLAYGLVGSAHSYMKGSVLMRHFSLSCIVCNLPLYILGLSTLPTPIVVICTV